MASNVKWWLFAKNKDLETVLSAGIRDANDATLRVVRKPGHAEAIPQITVLDKDGKDLVKGDKLKFG